MNSIQLFDPSMNLLSKVLDLRSANEKVISSNIANAETPGYAPARFEFEEQLNQAIKHKGFSMATTNPSHLPNGSGSLDSVTGTVVRHADKTGVGDKNGVHVDQEMVSLSENEIMYETAAQLLSKKISLLSFIIQGGSQGG